MKIDNINVREIFDSRGESTIKITGGNPWFFAEVASGKSRGSREAAVFSYREAVQSLKKLKAHIVYKNFNSIRALDSALIKIDGTEDKSKLGGNVMFGISAAFTRALAKKRGEAVWETMRKEFFPSAAKNNMPLIFSNIINGGAHAENNLDVQEYMVVVKPKSSMIESVRTLIRFYRLLGNVLKKTKKIYNIPIGDEGGYSLNFKNNFEPIAILEKLIKTQHLERRLLIALDAAANSFYKKGMYRFGGRQFATEELATEYIRYFKKSKLLFSLEDPFAETDGRGFALLYRMLPYAWVVGDDLTTTNPQAIKKYADEKTINAVIIKPNQIGTISETCDAIAISRKHKLHVIISHRSGEVDDHFIIHIAKACGSDGVKLGAPTRERIWRLNKLIEVYDR